MTWLICTLISGLTCTEQNFVTKAGAQRVASELGLIIVAPDTSPSKKYFNYHIHSINHTCSNNQAQAHCAAGM